MLDDDARLVEYGVALGHSGDQLEARQAQRPGAAHPAAPCAIDEPGAGDHFGQHHGHRLQRLDLDILVAPRLGMLDGEHADRAFETDDRNAREAMEMLLARLGAIGECRMIGRLCEIEDPALGGDRADQAFAHPQSGDVNGLLPEAARREQLEMIVAKQVD